MDQFLNMMLRMSPFLLLGFFFAGLLHAFIPQQFYSRYFSGNSFRSVFLSALFGVPLPLCSCGVIPTALSLKREGASSSSTVAFLIATPQTGVDSILATYSLLGLPFALLRPVAAFLTALFGGALVSKFGDNTNTQSAKRSNMYSSKTGFFSKLIEALRYGFLEMMEDIGLWLLIGMVIAAAISIFVPDGFFEMFSDYPLLSMLMVLIVSIPMYLCATGSIPIAAALMLKGLAPGSALVLLMAGPAVSAASILVVGRALGKRNTFLYILSIILGAMFFGSIANVLIPGISKEVLETASSSRTGALSVFQIVSSIIFGILFIMALIKRLFNKESCEVPSSGSMVVSISGMRCSHCRESVVKALTSLDGVTDVSLPSNADQASITGTADAEQIKKAIESLGFEVTSVKKLSSCSVSISGMRCSHCRESVVKALTSLDGVTDVSLPSNADQAIVSGNVDQVAIKKAVESLGFEVTSIN